MDPILIQLNPVHPTTAYIFKSIFNIIINTERRSWVI
jgi:hypothetical protein